LNTLINDSCPFCDPEDGRVVFQTQYSLAIWDGYPVTEGHILVVPKRHTPVWHNLRREELADIGEAIAQAQRFLRDRYAIDGFNVGFNEGAAAGQTVPHFHVHVIPRRTGDMADPRGGVRHVIPEKGNYVRRRGRDVQQLDKTPHRRALIAGGEDALLPHLIPHIQQANAIDVAVAFVLDSGVRILHPHLQEFLDRQGRLRIVAGDYLDVSDPTALRRLLDLDGNVQRWMFEANLLSFHPKSWIFHYDHSGVAIVGSSNISETALKSGIEWNYRVFDEAKSNGWADVLSGFEALIERKEIAVLTNDWIDRYEQRRVTVPMRRGPMPIPHLIQQRALEALEATRRQGYTAGLVVLATGLGKTWLSAFDSAPFERVLFVAHREEILSQAMATFRSMRPNSRLGRYSGVDKDVDADVLFASIQTLGRSSRAIGFCCSRLHADFMAAFFAERGLKAASVHSGDTSAPRVRSLERLQAGELDVVFAVDMFNEGVDVPEIDTVLMLRPTESAIVWMQQFGRGLRRSAEKSHLVVVDYIGNHRIFLSKVRSMLGATDGDRALALKLEAVRRKEIEVHQGIEWVFSATSERWKHACEDLEPQIFLVAQAVCAALDDADLVVEALDEAERDFVFRLAVGGDAIPMPIDHLGELFKRFEPLPLQA
jgi:diadenosine tetraphosphate (Ap4A) HIT family hydrolase/HKD family nuclease